MLRKTLITACLLVASGSAMANDEFVSRHGIAPRVSITFGGGHHDYAYRDTRYHDVYVPRRVQMQPVYYTQPYYGGNPGHHYGWGNRHDRHDEWREHRRDYDEDHDRRREHGWRHDD